MSYKKSIMAGPDHSMGNWAISGLPWMVEDQWQLPMHSSYDYNWADVNKNYYKHYSICQVTNQTIIDALDVPIAPHQINDTGL